MLWSRVSKAFDKSRYPLTSQTLFGAGRNVVKFLPSATVSDLAGITTWHLFGMSSLTQYHVFQISACLSSTLAPQPTLHSVGMK